MRNALLPISNNSSSSSNSSQNRTMVSGCKYLTSRDKYCNLPQIEVDEVDYMSEVER